MGEFKCPISECNHEPFKTVAGLKSHLRTRHPEFTPEDLGGAREVPIVEEDFATLLRKFKIRADLAANIAENVSHTGGPRAFEDAEILLKRLSKWSSDIPPAMRNNIIDQWFAEKQIDIPQQIQQRAGMTTDQIQKDEAATKEAAAEVRYIYDLEARQVRMAKEGERGGTIAQAKELKKMAEEDEGLGKESPFIQDGDGNWTLNPQARVGGVELMAFQSLKQAQERGEPIDPITAMAKASEQMKILRDSFGGGGSTLPTWMTDPAAFIETVKTITGGKGEDSAVREAMTAMQKTIEEMKNDRWQTQFDAQQKQVENLAGVLNKTLEAISDMKKERGGKTEMDILYEIADKGIDLAKTELPGLRRDIKEAISSVALPSSKTPEQREDRKKKFKQAIDTDSEIEELGRRIFFTES